MRAHIDKFKLVRQLVRADSRGRLAVADRKDLTIYCPAALLLPSTPPPNPASPTGTSVAL